MEQLKAFIAALSAYLDELREMVVYADDKRELALTLPKPESAAAAQAFSVLQRTVDEMTHGLVKLEMSDEPARRDHVFD